MSLGLAGLPSVPKAKQHSLFNSQIIIEPPLGRRPHAKQ